MARLIDQVTDKELLARWLFPRGQFHPAKRYMTVGDLAGNPGQSCVIWVEDGHFFEFNGGVRGDLVDVIMHRYGLARYTEARQWLYAEGWLTPGMAPEAPPPYVVELIDLPCAPAGTRLPESRNGTVHAYRWADGTIPLLVHRFQGRDGRKIIRRQTWDPEQGQWWHRWNDAEKRYEWSAGNSANARLPLYGLLNLARPDYKTVLLVEGEKTAKAGMTMFPRSAVVSPCGGSNPAWGTDWSVLEGKLVEILGDADSAGAVFSRKAGYFAEEAGAGFVRILDPVKAYQGLGGKGQPPRGWDIADAV